MLTMLCVGISSLDNRIGSDPIQVVKIGQGIDVSPNGDITVPRCLVQQGR